MARLAGSDGKYRLRAEHSDHLTVVPGQHGRGGPKYPTMGYIFSIPKGPSTQYLMTLVPKTIL